MLIFSFIKKVVYRLKWQFSLLKYPQDKPRLENLSIPGYRILAFINEDVGRQILIKGNYELEDSSKLVSLVKEGDVCFDIGCNVGYYTIRLASAAQNCKVYAFDPIPENCNITMLNASQNSLSNINVEQLAISNTDTVTDFSVSADRAFSSIIAVGRKSENKVISVISQKIDTFIRNNGIERIDILKVDVEGAEEMVIEGAHDLLSDINARPRIMMFELNDQNFSAYGTNVDRVISKIKSYGYLPKVCINNTFFDYDSLVFKNIDNIFFVRNE